MPSEASSIPITYYSRFPGEDFLSADLPDYEKERHKIVYNIVGVIALFIFVLPYFLATKKVSTSSSDSSPGSNDVEHSSNNSQPPFRKRNNNSKSKRRNGEKDTQPPTQQSETSQANVDTAVEISPTVSNALTFLCIILIFAVIFFSPNNIFPARTVILAPVFTKEECRQIISMAHAAAERNVEGTQKEKDLLMFNHPEFIAEDAISTDPHLRQLNKLDSMLKEPSGWEKDRHTSYPSTDLNIVTDPFTSDDRAWLASKLNARLAPLVERSFGIFRGAIRATDIFIVRYDASKGQANLRRHTDGSHFSFNVLLNDEFEGGGTRFHSRPEKSYIDIQPGVGEALISNAEILHEGLATTKGTRYILVGFDSIDEKDPLSGETTNLSLFSSWMNFSWMQVRFKEGFQDGRKTRILNNAGDDLVGELKYSRYAVSLFQDLASAMRLLIDRFAQFRILKLVATKDFDNYIQTMDQAMQQRNQTEAKHGIDRPSRGMGYASWFGGQQIDLDVFGNFNSIWTSRQGREDKFRGENL